MIISAKTEKSEVRRRTMESAAAILGGIDDKTLKVTNLNKALFYFDLVCLRDFGHQATKNAFIALKQGPVVAKYDKHLLPDLTKSGIASQQVMGDALPVTLTGNMDYEFLTEEERQLASKIGRQFAKYTAKEVSDHSHANPGWIIAFNEGQKQGKSPLPIDLRIALQQIMDEDPWLKDDESVLSKEAELACDRGEGDAW